MLPLRSPSMLPIRGAFSSFKPGKTLLFRKQSQQPRPVPSSRSRTHGNDLDNHNSKKATFQWVKGELLGKGSYAKVFLGLNANTGEIMAVKQVELPQTPSDLLNSRHREIADALKFERETLMGLDHRNIVQYLGYEESPRYLSIFLEYVPGGTISSCLQTYGIFSDGVTKSFTRQILEGLDYLHCKGIIHRDLKSDNILVEPAGICKISDFGISKQVEDISQAKAYTGMRGTIYWMAPEILDNGDKKGYDSKVDIWSIGCVVLEMWTGERPWFGEEIFPVMMKLSQEKLAPPIPSHLVLTDTALNFRRQCFQIDPQDRPSAAELQDHSYLLLPPNWRFEPFELTPLKHSLLHSSSTSSPKPSRSRRHTQSTITKDSTNRPCVPPSRNIDTVEYHRQSLTPQESSSGPQVVFITPLSSPPSQFAHPQNNSRSSLETVSTPIKGFRVVNPDDDELQAANKPFVYNPPPLPGMDRNSPYSSRLQPAFHYSDGNNGPYNISTRNRASTSLSRLPTASRYSETPFALASRTLSERADTDSDGDDDIWAKPPTDLSEKDDPAGFSSRQSWTDSVAREEWPRPPPAAVYEKLQEFFPTYDLEQAVVPIASVGTSTDRPEHGHERKKSIRIVAEDRAQSGPRRRTKLWNSNVEELHM
ncbi:hypothetical protein H0H93_015199 [Arthromyces matolae]|nr:hypothetical protein H0H93_015199 [Arthromyces matolae]